MQEWEYPFVDRSGILAKSGFTWINFARKKYSESREEFVELCRRIGRDGWELVNAQRDGQFLYLSFKRPKGEGLRQDET